MKWIKISDQIPHKEDYIIVYNEEEGVIPVFLWADLNEKDPYLINVETNGQEFTLNQFTHWMPLPNPPKD